MIACGRKRLYEYIMKKLGSTTTNNDAPNVTKFLTNQPKNGLSVKGKPLQNGIYYKKIERLLQIRNK